MGEYSDTLKWLKKAFKFLPFNLKKIEFYLCIKNLGKNPENLKLLREGIKYLPINL